MYKTAMILAGGLGTRFSEYTDKIPKPMILANGKPLLDHIIAIYSKFDVKNIIILAGYKNEKIIEHYEKFTKRISDIEDKFITESGDVISILDTGLNTMTGGRLMQGIESISDNNFYLTYGDGIADIKLNELTQLHDKKMKIATLTAVRPPARFGSLDITNNLVDKFGEKDNTSSGWINGGFFVVNREIETYLNDYSEPLEKKPLETLASKGQLSAYFHEGFWQPCDTIRELEILEKAMNEGLI
jgi:glucose-1-phosphate cytidylyltransferase